MLSTLKGLSLSAIQGEFGGGGKISLTEYYKNGSYVSTGLDPVLVGRIPTSGNIKISNFLGSAKKAPPGNIQYTTAGTFYFTVPIGIYTITIRMVGGGGGGGGGGDITRSGAGGGGSGGVFMSYTDLAVIPGHIYMVVVGTGGVGGYTTDYPFVNNGEGSTNGGATYIIDNTTGSRVFTVAGGNRGTGPWYGVGGLGPGGTSSGHLSGAGHNAYTIFEGGEGGSSYFGRGGLASGSSGPGQSPALTSYGAGGGGSGGNVRPANGGHGINGYVQIKWL